MTRGGSTIESSSAGFNTGLFLSRGDNLAGGGIARLQDVGANELHEFSL